MSDVKFWKWVLRNAVNPLVALRAIYSARFDQPTKYTGEVEEITIRLNGKPWVVSYRPNSTDLGILIEIFCKGYYPLSPDLNPRLIVDIGGNVGYSLLYFAAYFPQAVLHVFEPVPENVAMIRRQVERNGLRQVTIHPYGLEKIDGELLLSASLPGQSAGFSTCFVNESTAVRVPVRNAREVFTSLNLKEIDLFKIDCEGGELDIFDSISPGIDQIKLILGELHPTIAPMPETYALLAQISRTHVIDFEKKWKVGSFMFSAVRRAKR